MKIVRYERRRSSSVHVGILGEEGLRELVGLGSLGDQLSLRSDEYRERLAGATLGEPEESWRPLAPVDARTEVWACGVTYESSRDAREEESEYAANLYHRVYDAARPELFFKSAAWRVAGDGAPIAVRSDSTLDVPEAEVALVVNRFGEIVGYTACNDVSSRSIEGENPLYLPQAKIYLGGCALGPAIRPAWEVKDPYAISIACTIERADEIAWHGRASTSQLHRRFDDLVEHLFRADVHPEGVILSTGTCLVPEAPFSLDGGDIVKVEIGEVGILVNPVVRGLSSFLQASGDAAGRFGAPTRSDRGPS